MMARQVVVGVGACCVDLLALVDRFPHPDEKTRTRQLQVEGGGNCGNVMVGLARLGVVARPLAKMGADAWGALIAQQLRDEGVDTRSLIIKPGASSPFTYIIVDQSSSTRTCLHTPLSEDFVAEEELGAPVIEGLLQDCKLLFLDSRHPTAARLVADEARRRHIRILMDIEKVREGMDELLPVADYLNTSSHFPGMYARYIAQQHGSTELKNDSLEEGLVQLFMRHQQLRSIITTLGERGSMWTERVEKDNAADPAHPDIIASINEFIDENFQAWRSGTREPNKYHFVSFLHQDVILRVWYCPPEPLSSEEVVDTTGAGDAFAAATIYALLKNITGTSCTQIDPLPVLRFASYCGAQNCKMMGARAGMPRLTDIPTSVLAVEPRGIPK